jgi:RNA polymerase sigma factor (sigma-70 family)
MFPRRIPYTKLNLYGIFTSVIKGVNEDHLILEKYRDPASRDEALALLIDKYQKRLYWHIRKIVISHEDADDVLQETFVKAWTGLATFKGESSLFTWLYRIATNESLSHLRKKKRLNQVSIHPIEYQLSKELEADVYFTGDSIQLKLQQAILTLPEKQRLVFNMRYYDEMPYEEMSSVLDTSVGALKASYHIAAKKIEEIMQDH